MEQNKKKTVLVSGGAGYIGSHTSVELIEAGYDVVIVDNLSNSDLKAVEGVRKITGREIPFVEVDCCDYEAFRKVFEQYEFDSVIHFAASKAVGESVQKPLEYYQNNLTSFMNVIRLMREFGRRNIVFSSSCTVYGEADKLPVTEQTPRKPATSPYGNTKQMSEDILRDSLAAYDGLCGIALRYFNPIGAHPSALIGELPRGVPQNLVPYITQTAAGVRECLSVFGDDYPTPDGSCIRDYIDVVDLARAHVSAISRMVEGRSKASYEIFNIGTGGRHRPRCLGARAGAPLRAGQRREAQLPDCRPPRGRHRRHLGRPELRQHRAGMAGRAFARRHAPRSLGLGEAPARHGLSRRAGSDNPPAGRAGERPCSGKQRERRGVGLRHNRDATTMMKTGRNPFCEGSVPSFHSRLLSFPAAPHRRQPASRPRCGHRPATTGTGTYLEGTIDAGVTPFELRAQSPRARSTCSTMSRTAPCPPRNSET